MNNKRLDQRDVTKAANALESLCLQCEHCSDACYVAVAIRAIATIDKRAPATAAL